MAVAAATSSVTPAPSQAVKSERGPRADIRAMVGNTKAPVFRARSNHDFPLSGSSLTVTGTVEPPLTSESNAMRCAQRREVRVYSEPRIRNYVSTVPPGPSTFPRRTQCQRENGPGKRLRRFCLSGRWRFFGSRGKKTIGGSDLTAFPPSDGLTKRRKCVSTAAASSGFARVQDRASTW